MTQVATYQIKIRQLRWLRCIRQAATAIATITTATSIATAATIVAAATAAATAATTVTALPLLLHFCHHHCFAADAAVAVGLRMNVVLGVVLEHPYGQKSPWLQSELVTESKLSFSPQMFTSSPELNLQFSSGCSSVQGSLLEGTA